MLLGNTVVHIPQGWSTTARRWWEQREKNWRYLLLGCRISQSWPRNIVWTYFGKTCYCS